MAARKARTISTEFVCWGIRPYKIPEGAICHDEWTIVTDYADIGAVIAKRSTGDAIEAWEVRTMHLAGWVDDKPAEGPTLVREDA